MWKGRKNMEVAVNYNKIGDKIRERRMFLKMTQEKLANEIDVSASFISDIENGRRKMSLETMIKISIVLKTSLDYFILDNINSVKIKNEIKIEQLKNLLQPIDEKEQSTFLDFTINSARYLASRKR
ncbi:MAG: helix-turn-helix transcriptional regulator [Clostridiales bacterium]|nr:helix-turn-helix transcriptional regulator [Clostridiales bacterium]